MGKHRKIKAVDPFYHGARKEHLESKWKKSNTAPKNLDDQEVPYRLREIMKNTQKMKEQMIKKKKPQTTRKKTAAKPNTSATAEGSHLPADIRVPKFRRGKRESESSYLQRMHRETQHVMFLTKNQIDRQPEKEEAEAKPERKKSERKKDFDRKRLEKLLKKKNDRREEKLEKEVFTDPVKFGEVVMQPPSLTVKPRKSVAKEKPGQKPLLLKTLFNTSSGPKPQAPSMARERILLEERDRVVKAYRELKKLQQKSLAQRKLTAKTMEKFD